MKQKPLKFYYGYFENISKGLWVFTHQYFKAVAIGTSTEVNIYLFTLATSAVSAF